MVLKGLVKEGRSKVCWNPTGDGFAMDVDLALSRAEKWGAGGIAVDLMEVLGGQSVGKAV